MKQVQAILNLVHELSKLPNIGRKTAQRLAYHIVDIPASEAAKLADAVIGVKKKVKYCERCFNFTEETLCEVCAGDGRDVKQICVVESVRDLWAIENTGSYSGLYHVLHGAISPLDGIGVESLKMRELFERIAEEDIEEVVIATSATVPGEATALYISKLLKNVPGVKATRIAKGIPIGGELEYADEVTLARSIEGRNEF